MVLVAGGDLGLDDVLLQVPAAVGRRLAVVLLFE